MIIHDSLIERLIAEDVPYGDITTESMGISAMAGVMEFRARYACTAAGVDEAAAVLGYLGADVTAHTDNGRALAPGTLIMTAEGSAGVLHAGWKAAQNIMEHAVGIATRTRAMVDKGRAVNPNLVVACTRKSFPGGKTICMNAVQAGGGVPHRLGTSETFLLFDNHSAFFEDEGSVLKALKRASLQLPEKKLNVECATLDFAVKAAEHGAGILQFDKVQPDMLGKWIPELRRRFPHAVLAAAGGINTETIEAFASTGIDVAVTSFVYTGRPMDIEVRIRKVSAARK